MARLLTGAVAIVMTDRSCRTRLAARLWAAVLLVAAAYQVGLAMGLPLGEAVLGGRAPTVDGVLAPGFRVLALVQGAVLIGFAGISLARAEVTSVWVVPARFLPAATWVVVGFLVLNMVGNLAAPHPLERRGLGSTTLVISVLGAVVASGARPATRSARGAVPSLAAISRDLDNSAGPPSLLR